MVVAVEAAAAARAAAAAAAAAAGDAGAGVAASTAACVALGGTSDGKGSGWLRIGLEGKVSEPPKNVVFGAISRILQ